MTTNQSSREEEPMIGPFVVLTKSITPLMLAAELAAEYLWQNKNIEPTERELSQSQDSAK